MVYDTNIYISGIFWLGPSKQALHLAREGKVAVFTSQTLLRELREVLSHPEKPFRLSNDEMEKVVTEIQRYVSMATPTRSIAVCRDRSDNAVIECALAAGASHVVTGDRDLLDLSRFENIEIVEVRKFLAICESMGIR